MQIWQKNVIGARCFRFVAKIVRKTDVRAVGIESVVAVESIEQRHGVTTPTHSSVELE